MLESAIHPLAIKWVDGQPIHHLGKLRPMLFNILLKCGLTLLSCMQQPNWKELLRQGHTITSEHMRRIYPTGTSRVNWLGDLVFADTRDLRIPIDRVRLVKPGE